MTTKLESSLFYDFSLDYEIALLSLRVIFSPGPIPLETFGVPVMNS